MNAKDLQIAPTPVRPFRTNTVVIMIKNSLCQREEPNTREETIPTDRQSKLQRAQRPSLVVKGTACVVTS